MDFTNPKALLVATDDATRPWLALIPKRPSARHSPVRQGTVLIAGLLIFGLLVPVSAYNILSTRSAAALLQTAEGGSEGLATFSLPTAKRTAPAPELAGSFSVITPAVSAAGTDPVLRISHIGIEMPIIEGAGEEALWQGAWRSPFGSTPDRGGNTVLFGHRFLHLPPNPNTMFRLDELTLGDTFEIDWAGETYTYQVTDMTVVDPTDISVLTPTSEPTVTLITCTPKFTTKQRLVVRAIRI